MIKIEGYYELFYNLETRVLLLLQSGKDLVNIYSIWRLSDFEMDDLND